MCVKKCKEIFIRVKSVMGAGRIIMWTSSIHRSMCSSVPTAAPSSSSQASSSSHHFGDLLHTHVPGNQDGPGLGWTRPAMVYPSQPLFSFCLYLPSVLWVGGAFLFPFPFILCFLKTLPVWGVFNFYGGWSLFWGGWEERSLCVPGHGMCAEDVCCQRPRGRCCRD